MTNWTKCLRATILGVGIAAGAMVTTLAPTVAFAQAISGDVTGVVMDANKAVVVRADVAITNTETGVSYKTVTNGQGEYRISNLSPGRYDISVTAQGFGKAVIKDFVVQLNKVSTANFTLKVSATTVTVEVSEAGVALDTTTAQVGTTFDSIELTRLAAATNNVLNLSLMTAGVATSGGVGQGTGPSVGGQRPTQNNYTIEGIDNNDKAVPGPLVTVPSDAVAEFTALQNHFSAEYGHSNGGQFNQVIKSGTNQFHGLVYEYSQNRNYNATDASIARAQKYTNVVNPRYDDNRFGGQIGGPIKRNKLFFFTNYEQEPVGFPGASSTFCAPTADGFTTLDSISSLSANNLAVYKKYSPVAASQATADDQICPQTISVAGTAIPIGDVGVLAGSYTNNYRSISSVDYTISATDSIRARYLYNRSDGPDTAAQFPSFWATAPNRFHLATLSEFHTFSPNLSSEFRLGYNRFYSVYTAPGAFPGMDVFPNITIDDLNGVNIGPDPNAPQGTIQNTYQGSESIIWSHDKHTLKFGFEFRDVISPQLFVQRVRGDYEWDRDLNTGRSGLEQYLLDLSPNVLGERNATAPGVSPTYYGNQKVAYAYAQDDWRVSQNLTLNLGLRYEYTEVPLGEQKQEVNAAASVPGLITFGSPKSQLANFVPRLGFAYSIDPKTVIRGGFGMGYDVLYDNLGTLSSAPQYQVTEDVDTTTQTAGFLAGGGLPDTVTIPDVATQRALTSAYVPDQELPYAENWTLGIERTFRQNYTAEVRYVGTHGVHLPTQNRINRQNVVNAENNLPFYFQPTTNTSATAYTLDDVKANGTSWVPAYADAGFESSIVGFMPWSGSNYNGMAAQLNRRFSGGLGLSASYTWSKTMDDATATAFSTYLTPRRPQDFRHVGADYSRSALDHTNRLTLGAIYDLPFFKNGSAFVRNTLGNWEFAPAYTYQSPEYATVQSNVDANLNGDAAGDRVFVNPAGKKGTGSGSTAITDPALGDAVVGYYANDPDAYYVVAGKGTIPNGSRNTLPMRPINNFDVSAGKKIDITERFKLTFQAQIWNVLNHSQYIGGSINSINSVGHTDGETHSYLIPDSTTFNNPSATFPNNARAMQLALRFAF
jgi:hypothetical protein